MLALKIETVKNLTSQLDQQKRRMQQEHKKAQGELTQEMESLKRELELCRSDEIVKEAALIELRR